MVIVSGNQFLVLPIVEARDASAPALPSGHGKSCFGLLSLELAHADQHVPGRNLNVRS